jgi:class 3 adenylate cyclase/CHASE2 domain-containing sensor protein
LCCSGFFVLLRRVKLKPFKRVPVFIAGGIVVLACLLRILNPIALQRPEFITYDARVREALKFPIPTATNLGFIFINEKSLNLVRNDHKDSFAFYASAMPWPRQAYGRLIQELNAQGVSAIAFDILWGETREDQGVVPTVEGKFPTSDEYCAGAMRYRSNVIVAITRQVTPPPLFITNAMALGDITTDKDPDGVLRRVQIFRPWREWHDVFRQFEDELGFDLDHPRLRPGLITLTNLDGQELTIPLDAEGNFDLAEFASNLPAGTQRKNKPFVEQRVWHMGVVLGAKQLGLDLEHPEIDFNRGYVKLRGAGGIERTIPIDRDGNSYVNWSMPPNYPQLTQEAIHDLLLQNHQRIEGHTNDLSERWRGKLAVVGSSALIGNNLTDRGATPFSKDTILVSKHWNVANSILTGSFVHRSSLPIDLALIIALGAVTAAFTWQLRISFATTLVALLAFAYGLLCFIVYIRARVWLPMFLPVAAQVVIYTCLMTWRVKFEQTERKRVIEVFGTVVSKKIMDELLRADNLALGGARREITVLFADVRGFTDFTDRAQEQVEDYIRQKGLGPADAEPLKEKQAQETLETINCYLGLVADTILKHDAVLDKFIGDCVMAFWGAPLPDSRHAIACVRGAIDAQRAIDKLNQERATENQRLELENQARVSTGLPPLPLLPLLVLGSGINTGIATAGLMGSAGETKNYTVFGRDVNLASRLEGLSGRGRIFIGETTYQHLLRDDPALAATCMVQPPQKVKGFATLVKVYEVPWRLTSAVAEAPAPSDSTTFSASAPATSATLQK